MKKILLGLVSLSLVIFATACSSSSKKSSDCTNGNITMVTDTAGKNDKSFNEGTYDGIEKLTEESDGVCSSVKESTREADYLDNLNSASDSNPELIVAAGFKFNDAMKSAAKDNPDQNFLLIDTAVTDDNGESFPNVLSAVFSEHEGSFLVGIAAAMKAQEMGDTKVGFLGGEKGFVIDKFAAGYKAGVAYVDPSIEVVIEYAGSFTDASIGKVTAGAQFDAGIGIIFHAAGGAGNGVISEARERTQAALDADKPEDRVWVIGVDKDQYQDGMVDGHDGESIILTSMVKRVDLASYEISKKAINNEFKGGEVIVYDLASEGVGLPEENPNITDSAVFDKVDEATEKIISGEIEVPDTLE